MDAIRIVADAKVDTTAAPPETVTTVTGGQQIVPKATADTPAPSTPERPAGMPEKFKTVDELVKSYNELEKKMSGKQEATPAATPVTVTPEKVPAAAITETPAADTTAADQAKANELSKFAAEAAGGADKLPHVLEWAKANLSPEDAAAYNAAVDTGNVGLVKLAMGSVVKQYDAANGKAPALISGNAPPAAPAVQPFASNREMTAAMKDPRYKNDPAYQRLVVSRISGM